MRKLSSEHSISLRRAAKLLNISRSSLYYKPKGEKEENIKLMKLIDIKYTQDPTYGVRRMKEYLQKVTGKRISLKRVGRLMRKMNLKAVYPKPRATQSVNAHYTNLLRKKEITRPNQVWFADITYIKVKGGYGYCVAFIDGCSRKVMGIEISNTLSSEFCVEALREAVKEYGAPEVVHTDRGKQFVGKEFSELLRGRTSTSLCIYGEKWG